MDNTRPLFEPLFRLRNFTRNRLGVAVRNWELQVQLSPIRLPNEAPNHGFTEKKKRALVWDTGVAKLRNQQKHHGQLWTAAFSVDLFPRFTSWTAKKSPSESNRGGKMRTARGKGEKHAGEGEIRWVRYYGVRRKSKISSSATRRLALEEKKKNENLWSCNAGFSFFFFFFSFASFLNCPHEDLRDQMGALRPSALLWRAGFARRPVHSLSPPIVSLRLIRQCAELRDFTRAWINGVVSGSLLPWLWTENWRS